ncbi:thiol peroxidase [Thermoflavimicrobium daqui]|uniref:Thiol peroxidase n=1 Tax=Thermoflavimicrobium daqui TaxID=2137476 RepID=A0A364K7L2_9BACL|nr:thiol peroxidase [Thermoflavimicrobium daqui]RAL26212.1 thiol peroxidase [Thermoflavimicrobium daqui]
MQLERTNVVTLAGQPITLIGPEMKVGNQAPYFEVLTNDRTLVTSEQYKGKVRIICTVPSLDTEVCDQQTRQFNQLISDLSDQVVLLTISADLPFAQSRWCGAAGLERVQTLSDHLTMSFGTAYGTYIKENRLECRAVFVINTQDIITYVEYVPEVTQHPNYEAALMAVKACL